MGPSVLWGIGVLLLTIPMNAITLRVLNRLRKQENLAKDARNKRTTECISNMKILKLQVITMYHFLKWEDSDYSISASLTVSPFSTV